MLFHLLLFWALSAILCPAEASDADIPSSGVSFPGSTSLATRAPDPPQKPSRSVHLLPHKDAVHKRFKRGDEAHIACNTKNKADIDEHRHVVGYELYYWLAARCSNPFFAPQFWVDCLQRFEAESGHYEDQGVITGKYSSPDQYVCVPSDRAHVNGIYQYGPHKDIACVP